MTAPPERARAADGPPAENAEDLYENAPCGYVSTLPDGTVARINATLLSWLQRERHEVVGNLRLHDMLTPGGRIYLDTHLRPLLHMQGRVREIALEIRAADGTRLPVLMTSELLRDEAGEPLVTRTVMFDAQDRQAYERELQSAREREREVALTLQRALLAGVLPDDPRCAIVTRYRPAVAKLEVGGDWYDAFEIDTDRIGIAVGDVVGHGIEAAGATGNLRSALRALGSAGFGPARVMEELDRFVDSFEAARMATVAIAELNLADGRLRYCCAGHPPPMLVRAGRPPELLWDGRGAPLGAYPAPHARPEGEVVASAGSQLLLYTDGLVERRDRSLDDGFDQLLSVVRDCSGEPLDVVLDAVMGSLLAGAAMEDDVCVLGVTLATGAA